MFDERSKSAYQATTPPEALRGRVLRAAAAAEKRGRIRRRKWAAAAACLVLVVGLALGFSPAPAVLSGGTAAEGGGLTVTPQTILVEPNPLARDIAPEALGEPLEGCVPIEVDRAAALQAEGGTLYLLDPLSGTATELGDACKAAPGERLYWHCETGGTLRVRAGLRTAAYTLAQTGGGWTLTKTT